ncbi:phage tail spike protein, partial [Cohnella lubricantis]
RQILSKGDSDVKDENMRKSKKNEENINLLREVVDMNSQFRSRLEIWTISGRVGILANAFDVKVHEVVNGEFYVTFSYPLQENDEDRYSAIVEGNIVTFPLDVERGQRFRIRRVDESHAGRRIYKVVEAWHVAFDLGGYFMDDYIDFAAAKALPEMLALLGEGTPFTFAVEGNFEPHDVSDFGEDTKINLLQQLRKLYGAELSFDNYEITLTTRKGGNYGARIRYAHNLKGIKRTSHNMERITRLYGYGKDGLTIEGYAGHTVKYIDSPHFDPNNPFMGKMEWSDIDDQGRLLQEMQKYLAQYELPNVSYDVDFAQLEKVDPEFESEKIREAGDTVTVRDSELGYSFDARVNAFDRWPFERKSGNAVLSNFRNLTTADYIFSATVGSKKAIAYTSKNAVLKGKKYDDSLTLVDGMGMKVEDDQGRIMVRLGQIEPGIYGLAMYNKAGYKTIWQDANTGDAHFAGNLEAAGGTFSGDLQAAGGTFSGTIQAGTIIGGLIQGADVIASSIRTNDGSRRAEMSVADDLFAVYDGDGGYIKVGSIFDAWAVNSIQLGDVSGSGQIFWGGSGLYIMSTDGISTSEISPSSLVVYTFSDIIQGSNGLSLGSRLNSISSAIADCATAGVGTGSSPVFNCGIPIGTVIRDVNGNAYTWSGVPAHSHVQN